MGTIVDSVLGDTPATTVVLFGFGLVLTYGAASDYLTGHVFGPELSPQALAFAVAFTSVSFAAQRWQNGRRGE